MAAAALPKTVALRASSCEKEYLRYVHEGGETHRCMESTGKKVVSPFVKLELECAEGTPAAEGLVHIRCSYNNRYLVLADSWTEVGKKEVIQERIVAAAKSPEGDQSKSTCTLFKVSVLSDAPTDPPGGRQLSISLLHVNSKQYARISSTPHPKYGSCLFVVDDLDKNSDRTFHVTDWESLVILPRYVTFKCIAEDGLYLSSHPWGGQAGYGHCEYFQKRDIGDIAIGYEIFTNHDGTVRIKSMQTGQFWFADPERNILEFEADDGDAGNPRTFFQPVKVKDNAIALRSVRAFGNYCSTLMASSGSRDRSERRLWAGERTITPWTHLEVSEFAVSRKIYNMDFRLDEARTYNHKLILKGKGVAVNRTEKPNTANVRLSYTDVKSGTMKTGESLKTGFKGTLWIGTGIPEVFKVGVRMEYSGDKTTNEQSEQTNNEASKVEATYQVVVPPMSRVTVAAIASTATCDVPFSFTQHDTLYDGRQVIKVVHSGVYTGTRSHDMKYETAVEKLN